MRIFNRRARRDYQIIDTLEAGVALTGPEVKSIKQGRGDLTSSFVRIRDGEAWLVGASIPPYGPAGQKDYDLLRTRKLLLHKKEILLLSIKVRQKNLTLVPISVYTKGPRVKAEIALARGKKKYEKREARRKRDIEREVERELRGRG